jgi:hypothetical protein
MGVPQPPIALALRYPANRSARWDNLLRPSWRLRQRELGIRRSPRTERERLRIPEDVVGRIAAKNAPCRRARLRYSDPRGNRERNRKFVDSPPEGNGFELPVRERCKRG